MTVARRLLRPSLIALAAIFGASLTAGGTAQGSTTGGGACDPQKPSACCVARPETCIPDCCPSRAMATSRPGTEAASSVAGSPASGPACNPSACQCRSSEPAAPDPSSGRRTPGESSETGAWALAARLGHAPPASPTTFVDSGSAGRLRLPLYLLTTHLRF